MSKESYMQEASGLFIGGPLDGKFKTVAGRRFRGVHSEPPTPPSFDVPVFDMSSLPDSVAITHYTYVWRSTSAPENPGPPLGLWVLEGLSDGDLFQRISSMVLSSHGPARVFADLYADAARLREGGV